MSSLLKAIHRYNSAVILGTSKDLIAKASDNLTIVVRRICGLPMLDSIKLAD